MARLAPGGGITFDQFFAAIAQQESGGDYGAVNPRTGASGKYQILPSNIGPWSEQYLGRRISVSAFRSSPALQEQLAHAVLKDYFGRYGARGAAAAWYSGSPNKADSYTRFRKNEPSVGEYVDSVLRRVGQPNLNDPIRGGAITRGILQTPGDLNSTQGPVADPYSTLGAQPDPLSPLDGVNALSPQFDSLGAMTGTTGQTQAASALNPSLGMTSAPRGGPGGMDAKRARVISEAMRYIGTPYVWGGTSPNGFDCSGFTQFVLGQAAGIMLPRVSRDQANYGRRVPIANLRPGDLVALDNSSRNNGADHIAFWLGNGQIIEAPKPGASVRVRNIGKNEGFYGVALDY